MSAAAEQFITPVTMQALSQRSAAYTVPLLLLAPP